MTEVSRQLGIVDTVATGQAQFEDLVTRQSRFVFQVAYAIVRNAADSEDVVQETFLRIYRGRGWDRIEDERGYLARVAWRVAVDHRQRTLKNLPAPALTGGGNPEHCAIESDRIATVHRLIDALPEELRQPLALSTVEELTSAEIAKILGVPEGTVRTRLMRARQVLKQKLEAGKLR